MTKWVRTLASMVSRVMTLVAACFGWPIELAMGLSDGKGDWDLVDFPLR